MGLNDQRTEKVHELLVQAGAAKFYSSQWKSAIDVLLEAERICLEAPEEIASPYPELVGYRIALLRLREIKGLSRDVLLDLSERLARASQNRDFGPWPDIYRLVVLRKLKDKGALREGVARAVTTVEQESRLNASIYENDRDSVEYPAIAQSHIFNALELAVFFCELEYSPLGGMLDSFMGSPNAYVPGLSSEELTWSMIRFEGDVRSHRVLDRRTIERQSLVYYEDAVARGNKALLLCVGRDGRIDQDRSRCTDPSNLRKWTRDVSTAALVAALRSDFTTSTARDHRGRLRHFFGGCIEFREGEARIAGEGTLLITMGCGLWDGAKP